MSPDDGLDSELASFRKQWLSDLQLQKTPQSTAPISSTGHRRRQSSGRGHGAPQPSASTSAFRSGLPRTVNGPPSPTAARRALILDEGSDYLGGRSFDEPAPPPVIASSATRTPESGFGAETTPARKSMVSALDHYEEAMEKEAQGNMGESLQLYRKAYRMDHVVDRRYREKHFPSGSSKAPSAQASTPAQPRPSATASATASAPAKTSTAEAEDVQPKTFSELISDFAALKIEPAIPDVEGEPALPCPIAELPHELLTHILVDVAMADIAEYVRLSLVCKRLAYLIASEQRIWRRVCLGAEFGFAGMHYRWNRAIEWGPLSPESEDEQDSGSLLSSSDDEAAPYPEADDDGHRRRRRLSPRELAQRRHAREQAMTQSLTPSVYPTWKKMFRNRPRIRYDGCYISTVNYVRSGQASTNQLTWGGAPIHIVTYYRYLRFFRDGSLISLLASSEPAEVVHYMTRDALLLHREAASGAQQQQQQQQQQSSHLPGAAMRLAHRGRWRLSPPQHGAIPGSANRAGAGVAAPSGDDELTVETEGVGTKYVFKMDLVVRSAGKATSSRNNKLVLRGFYSYNKLTEDWAEFLLKNNKPFFFSRVRSYGIGE